MPRAIGPKFPILITSYEVALNDARKCFRSYNWKYLVVDEVNKVTYLNVYVSFHLVACLNSGIPR